MRDSPRDEFPDRTGSLGLAEQLGLLGRMGTVEPVFGNIQNKGMRRFTLRGQKKVNAQWKLFTMVHNIEKVAGVARR